MLQTLYMMHLSLITPFEKAKLRQYTPTAALVAVLVEAVVAVVVARTMAAISAPINSSQESIVKPRGI